MKCILFVLLPCLLILSGCLGTASVAMAEEIRPQRLNAGASNKPTLEGTSRNSIGDSSMKGTQGKDLFGKWSTACIHDESRSLKAEFTFMPDRSWTYSATEYRGKGCDPRAADSSVHEGGTFLAGQKLRNGTVEIDITIRNSLGNIYLVYSVMDKRLQLSGKCSASDIQDKRDAYCFGQPKPLGFTMLSRSLQLFDLSYSRE